MNKRLTGITYLDVPAAPPPAPFFVLTRWQGGNDDLSGTEREIAEAAGITFDDFGLGLCYDRQADAEAVAAVLAPRVGYAFGVVGDECQLLCVVTREGERIERDDVSVSHVWPDGVNVVKP